MGVYEGGWVSVGGEGGGKGEVRVHVHPSTVEVCKNVTVRVWGCVKINVNMYESVDVLWHVTIDVDGNVDDESVWKKADMWEHGYAWKCGFVWTCGCAWKCVESLYHTMLLMLWFCRATKYRSVRQVAVARRPGAESTSPSFQHLLFFAGGKLTWPISAELEEVDRHREDPTKMANSLIWISSFFCLLLLRKFQGKCDGSEEKQVVLSLGAGVRHQTGHHFI